MLNKEKVSVAVLDLYEGVANQGMRCIRQIVKDYGKNNDLEIVYKEFDVRLKKEVPSLDYDIYISSGGPGSPLGEEGNEWEAVYFNWLQTVDAFNNDVSNPNKKFVLFICHSFQMACRY